MVVAGHLGTTLLKRRFFAGVTLIKMDIYIKHFYIKEVQEKNLWKIKDNLVVSEIAVLYNVSENYSCVNQKDMQIITDHIHRFVVVASFTGRKYWPFHLIRTMMKMQ